MIRKKEMNKGEVHQENFQGSILEDDKIPPTIEVGFIVGWVIEVAHYI